MKISLSFINCYMIFNRQWALILLLLYSSLASNLYICDFKMLLEVAQGCPLWLEMLEMLESKPFFRIWQEKLENHRFFSCFGWKSWNFMFGPKNNKQI